MKVRNRYGYCLYTRHRNAETSLLKDPGSAITHFIGVVAAASGAAPLLVPGSSDRKSGLHSLHGSIHHQA